MDVSVFLSYEMNIMVKTLQQKKNLFIKQLLNSMYECRGHIFKQTFWLFIMVCVHR